MIPRRRPSRLWSQAPCLILLLLHDESLVAGDKKEGRVWDYSKAGEDWGALCHGFNQSPININPDEDIVDSELEVRVQYEPWRLDATERGDSSDGVPRVLFRSGHSPGQVLVGTGYGDLDEYTLSSVEIHAPSEHSIRHSHWPVEIQLWHEPTPLRRIARLAAQVKSLTEGSQAVETHLNAIQKENMELSKELRGASVPWEAAEMGGGALSVEQTLDWIDATKDKLSEIAIPLRQDTYSQLKQATEIANAVDEAVQAQQREFASYRVAISIFTRIAGHSYMAPSNRSGSGLIRWLTQAVAPPSNRSGQEALDVKNLMSHMEADDDQTFFAYRGSMARPPCNPNVRWFVIAKPLSVSGFELEELLNVTGIRKKNDGIIGIARGVQPLGRDRQLYRVLMSGNNFEEPVLSPIETTPERIQKWTRVERYCRLFFLCSVALLSSPLLLRAARFCLLLEDEEKTE